MTYDVNASNKTSQARTFYTSYIRPTDSSTGHSVFNLSTKQLLTTPQCQSVPMPDDIIQAVNEIGTITNKIQLDHFHCDQHTVQQIILVILKMVIKNTMFGNQEHYISMEISDHESDSHLDDSQQIAGENSDTRFFKQMKFYNLQDPVSLQLSL